MGLRVQPPLIQVHPGPQVAHFFWVLRGGLLFGQWSKISCLSPFFFQTKGGWTSIWSAFFGGPGVDFYSDVEQTRGVDLY